MRTGGQPIAITSAKARTNTTVAQAGSSVVGAPLRGAGSPAEDPAQIEGDHTIVGDAGGAGQGGGEGRWVGEFCVRNPTPLILPLRLLWHSPPPKVSKVGRPCAWEGGQLSNDYGSNSMEPRAAESGPIVKGSE